MSTVEPTIELTTRLAKLVAKKTRLPTYVGNSMSFASAGLGGTVDEEMEAFKHVSQLILSRLKHLTEQAQELTNGDGAGKD